MTQLFFVQLESFLDYFVVIGEGIKRFGSQACYDQIKNGTAELEKKLQTLNSTEAQRLLKLSPEFDVKNFFDVSSFFRFIATQFSIQVESRRLQYTCNSLLTSKDNITGIINFILSKSESQENLNISYANDIHMLLNTTYNIQIPFRQILYQKCSELGWFPTTDSFHQPFGTRLPLSTYLTLCSDIFDQNFTTDLLNKQADQFNAVFNGFNIDVQNIYMARGEFDPLRSVQYQNVVVDGKVF